MDFVQLKPLENSFYTIASGIIRRFYALILCEGRSDSEIVKAVARKLELMPNRSVGITDCGGKDSLKNIASYAAILAEYSRKLNMIGVIIDADKYSPNERAHSFFNSIKAHLGVTSDISKIADAVYTFNVERLQFVIHIAGDVDLPFTKHEIEDYVVRLIIRIGKADRNSITGVRAKAFLECLDIDFLSLIEESTRDDVEDAFSYLINFLRIFIG